MRAGGFLPPFLKEVLRRCSRSGGFTTSSYQPRLFFWYLSTSFQQSFTRSCQHWVLQKI